MLSTLPPSWLGARKTGTVFLVIPNRLPRPRYWMNHQLCGEMPEEGFRAALRASYQIESSVSERNSPELGEDDAMESHLNHNSPLEIPLILPETPIQ